MAKLLCVSQSVLSSLSEKIELNTHRYINGDFFELEKENGWRTELDSVDINYDALTELNKTDINSEGDLKNSLKIFSALKNLSPAMAREERIWVRLTHIECLDYSRARWGFKGEGEDLTKYIHKHFFARTRTQIRDDNAISRLWWNAWIASNAFPEDPKWALEKLLFTADIRSNIVERPAIAMSRPVMAQIFIFLEKESWLTEKEKNFRSFMKVLNRDGGGLLFDAMDSKSIAALLRRCIDRAKAS